MAQLNAFSLSNEQDKINECARNYAEKFGFKNFEIIESSLSTLECKYDWIDESRGIDEKGFENTWYVIPTSKGYIFEF